MNTVATRSTDPGVRAVTATCRAAAKVNNGDVAELGPDLDEARRRADSLPPKAELDVTFTTDLTDVTRLMINLGQASSVASAPSTVRADTITTGQGRSRMMRSRQTRPSI